VSDGGAKNMTANIKGPFTLSLGWKFLRWAGTLQLAPKNPHSGNILWCTYTLFDGTPESSGVQIPPHPKSTLSVCWHHDGQSIIFETRHKKGQAWRRLYALELKLQAFASVPFGPSGAVKNLICFRWWSGGVCKLASFFLPNSQTEHK